jgi:hypothetical protein
LAPKYEHSDEFSADPQAFWDAMRPIMLKPPVSVARCDGPEALGYGVLGSPVVDEAV